MYQCRLLHAQHKIDKTQNHFSILSTIHSSLFILLRTYIFRLLVTQKFKLSFWHIFSERLSIPFGYTLYNHLTHCAIMIWNQQQKRRAKKRKENESGQQASNNKKRFYLREWEYWYGKFKKFWGLKAHFVVWGRFLWIFEVLILILVFRT